MAARRSPPPSWAAEPVHRVEQRAELARPGGRGSVERPGDRARTSEPRDLARLGRLPALRELRGERIPGADELAGRNRAQRVGRARLRFHRGSQSSARNAQRSWSAQRPAFSTYLVKYPSRLT